MTDLAYYRERLRLEGDIARVKARLESEIDDLEAADRKLSAAQEWHATAEAYAEITANKYAELLANYAALGPPPEPRSYEDGRE